MPAVHKFCFHDSKMSDWMSYLDFLLPALSRFTTLVVKIKFAILFYEKNSQWDPHFNAENQKHIGKNT